MKAKITLSLCIIVILFTVIFMVYAISDPYTVIFNVNAPDVSEISSMNSSAIHKNGLPVPDRKGWKLVGWYLDSQTWKNEYIPDDDSDMRGNIQVYARWAKEECTVKFDVLDGTVVSDQTVFTVKSGESFTPPPRSQTFCYNKSV
ncbi:MAG: InlB B-repeat-containing protein [Eubacteriales bacterium]